MAHLNPIRCEGEHHRGFHVAAVDAKAVLLRREEGVDVIAERQSKPVGAEHQHVESGAQIARHDIHHAQLPAVRIEEHQLFDASAVNAFANFRPHRDQGFGFEREGAWKAQMFIAFTHLLCRQKQRPGGAKVRQCRRDHAIDQICIHRNRQMRPMLLDGSNRQHGDQVVIARCGELSKVVGGQIGPEMRGKFHALQYNG